MQQEFERARAASRLVHLTRGKRRVLIDPFEVIAQVATVVWIGGPFDRFGHQVRAAAATEHAQCIKIRFRGHAGADHQTGRVNDM